MPLKDIYKQADEPVRKSESGRYGEQSERAADILAGEGSLAGKLRARRIAVEEGDIEGATEAFKKGEHK